MKLLLVINHIDWFWSHRLPLARAAQEQGYDVHIAVSGARADTNLEEQNFTGHELPESGGALSIFQIMASVVQILRQEKPDVMHAITLKYAFIAGLAAQFCKDMHVVHTLAGLGYLFIAEGTKPKILRMLIGPFLKLALKGKHISLIFQNPDDMALMIKRGFAEESQCTLIRGSGVDLNEYPFTSLPDEKETPIVLMPTRLVHEKGVAVFIDAARIIADSGIEARFQIAGGITDNPRAISKIEMENMIAGTDVEWLGKVTDMPVLYQQSSLICYPSYYGEGVPKVLLEAASTGRAIITTDHAGCREAVEDGVNGILVPVKNAKATADAIVALLGNREKLSQMGKASHDLAAREYDVKSVVARTLEVYKR